MKFLRGEDVFGPRAPSWIRWLTHLALALFVARLGWALWTSEFAYNVFSDRELTRGALWGSNPQVMGGLTGREGARIPGPLLDALFALPHLVSSEPRAAYLLQVLLDLASVVLLYVAVARWYGVVAGLMAAVLWGTDATQIDSVSRLWNPGMLPCFVVLATVALLWTVVERDGRGLVALAAGLVGAAQLHLSAVGLACAAVPVALAARPRRLRDGVLGASIVGVVAYAPYLWAEARHGAPNTRALWANLGMASSGPPLPTRFVGAVRVLGEWTEDAMAASDASVLVRVAPACLAAAMAGVMVWRLARRSPLSYADRGLVGLACVVVLGTLGVAVGTPMPHPEPRYVLPLLVSVSVLAGVGSARLLAAAWRVHALAVVPWMAVAVGMCAARLPVPTDRVQPFGYSALREVIDGLRKTTGWTLPEVVGRTVWGEWRPGAHPPWDPQPTWVPVEHLLAAEGRSFPGSQPPPCALVVSRVPVDAQGLAWSPEQIVEAFVPSERPLVAPPVMSPLPRGSTLIVYERAGALCPTTMTQRYVETPVEAAMHARAPWPVDTVAELPVSVGRRFVVSPRPRLPGDQTMTVAVDIVPTAEETRVRIECAQLRGFADNGNWYGQTVIRNPRLVATDAVSGATRSLVVYPFLVGGVDAFTPLEQVFRPGLGSGVWRIELAFDQVPHMTGWGGSAGAGGVVPWQIALTDGWTLP